VYNIQYNGIYYCTNFLDVRSGISFSFYPSGVFVRRDWGKEGRGERDWMFTSARRMES
jgi:hypothetical protein